MAATICVPHIVISNCPDELLLAKVRQWTISSYLFARWQCCCSGWLFQAYQSSRSFSRPLWLWPKVRHFHPKMGFSVKLTRMEVVSYIACIYIQNYISISSSSARTFVSVLADASTCMPSSSLIRGRWLLGITVHFFNFSSSHWFSLSSQQILYAKYQLAV